MGYALLCLAVFWLQDGMLFHPTVVTQAELERIEDRGAEPLVVQVDGATLRGFFVPGAGKGALPTILYFGGNAEPVWRNVEEDRWVGEAGFHRVFVSYRGYDRSTGEPSAQELLSDGVAIYDAIASRPDVDRDAIVTWGLSLGTGIAARVARDRPVAGVVLVAPYDRLADVATEHYPYLPVRWLMTNDIDTIADAPSIESPALMIHGDADRIIPLRHGRRLADAWGGRAERAGEFIAVKGAHHNDVSTRPEARQAIERFLSAIARR